ncbi:MAG: SDR family oxidoreductase [Lachnospiraceae bacterium]|nr:SDR family oxidoreductase [Lachnospiraceae bacterium]
MKKALVTGASRGIGYAVAERLKEEYELFLICKSNPDLMSGLPGRHYTGDTGDHDFIEKVINDMDSVDLLVNNAGIACFDLIQDMTPEKWNDVLRTDLSSIYNTSHFAAKKMISRHSGRIINISSVWGLYGASCESAYSAAKGGVNAFTKALAKELAPSGIAVNALAPGVIDTDMNKNFSDEERADLTDRIPAGRMGTPEEVAEAVYLLSEMPVYLTGQIISIDGGFI